MGPIAFIICIGSCYKNDIYQQYMRKTVPRPPKQHFFDPISGPTRPNLLIFELSLSFDITKRDKKEFFNFEPFYSSYRDDRQTDKIFFAVSSSIGNHKRSETPTRRVTKSIVNALDPRTSYGSKKFLKIGFLDHELESLE